MKLKKLLAIGLALSLALTPAASDIFLTPGVAYAATKTVKVKGVYHQSDARKMLKKINKFRTGDDAWYYESEGSDEKVRLDSLEKYTYDYTLEKVAMKRAAEIAYSFSHTRPNGEDCFSLYPDGYGYKGENIAMGQPTVASVFESWQETNESYSGQGHRRNMLDENFTCIGIACFEVNGYKYWVQEFGSPTLDTEKTAANNKTKTVKIKVWE